MSVLPRVLRLRGGAGGSAKDPNPVAVLRTSNEADSIAQLGVDFGTSTFLVSASTDGAPPAMIRMSRVQGSQLASELSAWWEADKIDAVFTQLMRAPFPSVPMTRLSSVKRHFSCVKGCQNPKGTEPWCTGDGIVVIDGREVFLEEIIARAVAGAVETVELVFPAEAALVAACPVDWGLSARKMMASAVGTGFGRSIGPGALREEPVLAAKTLRIASGLQEGRYLVIDIGGGSTDLVIIDVRSAGSGIEVLASEGDRWLGGDDVDFELRKIVLDRLALSEDILSPEDRYEFRRLVEAAKKDLTNGYPDLLEVNIEVGNHSATLTFDDLNTAWDKAGFPEQLTRMARLALCKMIERVGLREIPNGCVRLLHDRNAYISNAGVLGPLVRRMSLAECLAEIDGLASVGGATILHQYRTWVDERVVRPTAGRITPAVRAYGDPVEAVARGAASTVPVRGLSLFRLPYWLLLRRANGEDVVLLRPFADALPTTPQRLGYHYEQPRLLVLDETFSEDFGTRTLGKGEISFWFDDLQRLHIKVNADETIIPMPWQEGALLEPIHDREEREALERMLRLGELLKKPNYYDE